MISYIREIVRGWSPSFSRDDAIAKVLGEELDRLDPRDFLPDARYEFVMLRAKVHNLSRGRKIVTTKIDNVKEELLAVLSKYAGEGSRAETRRFPFIHSDKLREIVERDYKELSLIWLPDEAWKSTVVMAGSIL